MDVLYLHGYINVVHGGVLSVHHGHGLHEIGHEQAIDDEARSVFGADRRLADVLTESAHLVRQ